MKSTKKISRAEMKEKLKFVPRSLAIRPALAFMFLWQSLVLCLVPVIFERDSYGAELRENYKIKNVISGESSNEAKAFYALALLGLVGAGLFGAHARRREIRVVDEMNEFLSLCRMGKGMAPDKFVDVYLDNMNKMLNYSSEAKRAVMSQVIAQDVRHFDMMIDAVDIAKGKDDRLSLRKHNFDKDIAQFVMQARLGKYPQDVERVLSRFQPYHLPASILKAMRDNTK